jgi:hypothetical protein
MGCTERLLPCLKMSTLAAVAVFLAARVPAVTVVFAQPSPPAQGIQLASCLPFDVFFPLTVSQCEPVFVYYNTTVPQSFGISTISGEYTDLIIFAIPTGIGYFEWICNIPAGYTIIVDGRYVFVVQPGWSSSCLGDITTTYPHATYITTAFRSYTANPANTTVPRISRSAMASYVCFSQMHSLPSTHPPLV